MMAENQIQVKQTGLVGLVEGLDKLVEHFNLFEEVKKKLLVESDYYDIVVSGKQEKAIGKTGWYKLGVAFGLSFDILAEEREYNEKTQVTTIHMKIRCYAPNGRYTDDVGSADDSSKDREGESVHVLRAQATTRAKERCVISMLGASEKSANDLAASSKASICKCIVGVRDWNYVTGQCNKCKLPLPPEAKSSFPKKDN